MLLSTTFRLKQNRRLCPLRDGHDDDDGVFGIPPPLSSLTGEHPINTNAGMAFPRPSSARKPIPAVRKIPRFFRLRLQGVTLHFALQSRVPDVPSGLPYGRAYALLILRFTLQMEEQRRCPCQHEGASQNCRHTRHGCHAPRRILQG